MLGQEYIRFYFERVLKLGDNADWADPDLDHKDWDYEGSTPEIGNFWVRMRLNCDTITDTFENAGMHVISSGSYELYWDGVLLSKNGKVGTSPSTEVPGRFFSQVLVPDSLMTHGVHTVAFRVSNYNSLGLLGSWNHFYLEEFKSTQERGLNLAARMCILAGIFLMAAIYYLLLYLLRKREAVSLIFSIICFLFFGLIIMEYMKFLVPYPYPFHTSRLLIIYLVNFTVSLLVPSFLILYFHIPRRKWLISGLAIFLLIISVILLPGTDITNQYLSIAMWWASFAVAVYAVIQKKKGSQVILGALLLAALIIISYETPLREVLFAYDVNLFLSFAVLVMAMMYLLAKLASEQRKAYEASLLLSSRLQNELLKKNIQPHFIMNTLTSLMGWIEESPKDSVQFIEALSKEFEIMSEIAEEKLIPVQKEIELCAYHIEIMKFRKEIDYVFEYNNIPETEMIPPAVFHTILENGITHSIPDAQNQIKMILDFEQQAEFKKYSIRTIAMNRKTEKSSDGTGLAYIKSRLRESFGTEWKLESEATGNGWETSIYIYQASS